MLGKTFKDQQVKIIYIGISSLGCLIVSLLFPIEMIESVLFAGRNLIKILPVILVGMFLSAYISATGLTSIIATVFKGKSIRMILFASAVGALLPVCGVSVLPLVAGLLVGGVPLSAIMAFWLSSPITSPSMMAVTAGTLGNSFAIGKTLAAFGIGLLGGILTLILTRLGFFTSPARANVLQHYSDAHNSSCNNSGKVHWKFWQQANRIETFTQTALYTGKLMLMWLCLAFIAEYWLRQYLSTDWLSQYVGTDQTFAIPLAAIIGAPIYLDGYAALPLVRGMIENGMGEGAAMAFLIAGGITSTWAAIPVYALVRIQVFIFYIILAISSAMISGWAYAAFIT